VTEVGLSRKQILLVESSRKQILLVGLSRQQIHELHEVPELLTCPNHAFKMMYSHSSGVINV